MCSEYYKSRIKQIVREEKELRQQLIDKSESIDASLLSLLDSASKEDLQKVIVNIVKRKGLVKSDVQGFETLGPKYDEMCGYFERHEEEKRIIFDAIAKNGVMKTKLLMDMAPVEEDEVDESSKKQRIEKPFDWGEAIDVWVH